MSTRWGSIQTLRRELHGALNAPAAPGAREGMAARANGLAVSRRALPITEHHRRWALCVALAVLAHASALAPTALGWLRFANVELAEMEGEAVIPVDLEVLEAIAAPPELPPLQRKEPATVDPDVAPPAKVEAPGEPAASAASETLEAGDPVDAAGAAGKFSAEHPNVQILLVAKVLREHELGGWLSRILKALPQWSDFFGGTSLEPVQDFDHILITGPQLRKSDGIVVIGQYRTEHERIRKAIDGLVRGSRPEGRWLGKAEAPVEAALFTADRAERIAGMYRPKKLVAVIPPANVNDLGKLKKTKGFGNPKAAAVLSLVTPHRAFRGLPIEVPKSIAQVRVWIYPAKDGDVLLTMEALDESDKLAEGNARKLGSELNRYRTIDLGILAVELFPKLTFQAEGKVIRTETTLSRKQVALILGEVEHLVLERGRARAERAVPENK